jgi:thioredoxin-related protein
MNKIILSVVFGLVLSSTLYSQEAGKEIYRELGWQESFESAKILARSEKKPLFIFFTGSDWCGPCRMLVSDLFGTEKFKGIADKEFVLYKADFPRNKGLVNVAQKSDNFKIKLNYGIKSFPTVLIINEKGTLLGKIEGYNSGRVTNNYFFFIDSVLKKISKS